MIDLTVYSLGDPGTFDITDKNDPMYYVARLNHELSKNLYNLNTASAKLQQNTTADYGTLETTIDTYLGNVDTWLGSAVAAQAAGSEVPALPTFPDIFDSLALAAGIPPVLWFVAKLGIQIGMSYLKKRFDSGTDMGELAAAFREAWIGKNGEDETYPYLLLMAQRRLEILLNRTGDLESVYYDEPTE
jgi:hypothetical protein